MPRDLALISRLPMSISSFILGTSHQAPDQDGWKRKPILWPQKYHNIRYNSSDNCIILYISIIVRFFFHLAGGTAIAMTKSASITPKHRDHALACLLRRRAGPGLPCYRLDHPAGGLTSTRAIQICSKINLHSFRRLPAFPLSPPHFQDL